MRKLFLLNFCVASHSIPNSECFAPAQHVQLRRRALQL
jgi:hypothetical protein